MDAMAKFGAFAGAFVAGLVLAAASFVSGIVETGDTINHIDTGGGSVIVQSPGQMSALDICEAEEPGATFEVALIRNEAGHNPGADTLWSQMKDGSVLKMATPGPDGEWADGTANLLELLEAESVEPYVNNGIWS